MEGRQRRSFTDDYKRQAVDLVASSGRSIGSVAKELGQRDIGSGMVPGPRQSAALPQRDDGGDIRILDRCNRQ
jgi:hypothetical protein